MRARASSLMPINQPVQISINKPARQHRVVHHALILELTGDSYRSEKARSRETADKAPRKATGDE